LKASDAIRFVQIYSVARKTLTPPLPALERAAPG